MSMYGEFLDPYQCVAVLRCPQSQAKKLRKTIGGLLEGLDPTLQIISLVEETSLDGCAKETKETVEKYELFSEKSASYMAAEMEIMKVPSLSVCLFLLDKGSLSAENVKKGFKELPWKLHHSIELSNSRQTNRLKYYAKQEFYEIDKGEIYANTAEFPWPLWSVSSIHYGNEHLRFTIFTKRHKDMVQFYRSLTGGEAEYIRDSFCYFKMYSQPGLDIQLALKSSPSLDPHPPQSCNLCIRTTSLQNIICFLDSDPVQLSLTRWMVQDPDGNHLVIEEVRESLTILPRVITYFDEVTPHEPISSQYKSLIKPRPKPINSFESAIPAQEGADDTSSCCSFCKQVDSGQSSSTDAGRTSSFDSGFSGLTNKSAWSLSSETDSDTFTLADSDWEGDSTISGASSMVLCSTTTLL